MKLHDRACLKNVKKRIFRRKTIDNCLHGRKRCNQSQVAYKRKEKLPIQTWTDIT